MTDKNDFQARLKRLEAKRGPAPREATQPVHAAKQVKPTQTSKGVKLMAAFGGVVFAVIAACAIAIFLTMPGPSTAKAFAADVGDEMDGTTTVSIDDPVRPAGFLVSLISGQERSEDRPRTFLPPAHGQWIRVTTKDASDPQIRQLIADRWATATGQAMSDLEAHPYHRQLDYFIDSYANPDIEMRVKSKSRSRAVYLHASGAHLVIAVRFLPERTALGEDGSSTEDWIAALMTQQQSDADSDQTVQRVSLGSATVVSTYKTSDLTARPLTVQPSAANVMDIAVPFSRRTVLSVQGQATAREAQRFIEAVDGTALMARLN